MKSKVIYFLLAFLLIYINYLFFKNLQNLPNANYSYLLIAINIDLIFLIIVSAIIFRKLIKVYLGKSQNILRRKLSNITIRYIYIPLLLLNIVSIIFIIQSTKEFFTGKLRELSKEAEIISKELKEHGKKELEEKKEILLSIPEEFWNKLPFVEKTEEAKCSFHIKGNKICLGNKIVYVKENKEILFKLELFKSSASDLRSFVKAKDIITGIYIFFIVALSLISLLATVWLSMLVARYISEPIERLTSKAIEISKGNLNVEIKKEETGDEIEKLSVAFKRMKDNLAKLYKNLESEKERLEKILNNIPVAVLFIRNREVIKNETFKRMFGDGEDPLKAIEKIKENKNIRVEKVELEEGKVYIFEDITPIVLAERFKIWQDAVRRIAHEIKNPLTPIRLNLERILRNLEKGNCNEEKLKELITVILKEVNRINLLVNQFKSISTDREIKPEKLKISEVLDEIIKIYSNTGIKIHFEGDKEVLGDRGLLKEAFYNLVNNSIENGAKKIHIKIENEKLIYRDDGKGISEEDAKHIFEPFFSKNPKGFGIGMSLVKKIVEEHGWEVKVFPSDKGFHFEIDFKSRN